MPRCGGGEDSDESYYAEIDPTGRYGRVSGFWKLFNFLILFFYLFLSMPTLVLAHKLKLL